MSAEELFEQAKKRAHHRSLFGRKKKRYQQSADLFCKAGEAFLKEHKIDLAGQAYQHAGIYYDRSGDLSSAVDCLTSAFNCLEKLDSSTAIRVITYAIYILVYQGEFSRASQCRMRLATLYQQMDQIDHAIQEYQTAYQWLINIDSSSDANYCLYKIGILSEGETSIRAFETLAERSMDHPAWRTNIKEYLFKAALQHLLQDPSTLDTKLKLDSLTQECQFLRKIAQTCQTHDRIEFNKLMKQYDQSHHLDHWETAILLQIKERWH